MHGDRWLCVYRAMRLMIASKDGMKGVSFES